MIRFVGGPVDGAEDADTAPNATIYARYEHGEYRTTMIPTQDNRINKLAKTIEQTTRGQNGYGYA